MTAKSFLGRRKVLLLISTMPFPLDVCKSILNKFLALVFSLVQINQYYHFQVAYRHLVIFFKRLQYCTRAGVRFISRPSVHTTP